VCPLLKATRECEEMICPVDCVVSEWQKSWHAAKDSTDALGVGTHKRHTKYMAHQDEHKGKAHHGQEVEDHQIITRTRTIISHPAYGGKACPELTMSEDWKDEACNQSYALDDWSACSKACGGGVHSRFRHHIMCSKSSLIKFRVKILERAECNTEPCAQEAD